MKAKPKDQKKPDKAPKPSLSMEQIGKRTKDIHDALHGRSVKKGR